MGITTIDLTKTTLLNLPRPEKGGPAQEYRSQYSSRIRIMVAYNFIYLVVRFSWRGKRYYKRFGTFPELKIRTFIKLAEQYISDVQTGEFDKDHNFTMGQVVGEYFIPYSQQYHRDHATVKSRIKGILKVFGDKKINEIKTRDVVGFLNGFEGRTNATINRYRSLISKIFSLAIELEIVAKNPCALIKKLPENNHRDRILSLAEIKAFCRLTLLDSNIFQACSLLLSLTSGMRIGNVISLKYSMFSSDFSFVTLPITKSGKSQRVYLNDHARQIVRKCTETSINDFVFPSLVKDGKHMGSPRTCLKRIQSAMQEEGCLEGHFNILDLRRTFASFMLLATGDIRLAQQSLGQLMTELIF